jgi:hypothetical protein
MTEIEFRVLCATLRIDGNEIFADLFGISWRTAQRYWYGEIHPPEPLARLLRLCANLKLSHAKIRELTTRQEKPAAV